MNFDRLREIIGNNITKPRETFDIQDTVLVPFLNGEKFSDHLSIDILRTNERFSREEFILREAKGKRVLHIGFVDHIEIVDKKIKNKTWLHELLVQHTTQCIGIDIHKEGVEYIKNKYGYRDIYTCDLTQPDLEFLTKEHFDVMVLGEIIEHVDNPNYFLEKIHTLYKDNVDTIIITTPNAFSYNIFARAKRGFEMINSDHKTLFSYYTLLKNMFMAGFEVEHIYFADPSWTTLQKICNKIVRTNIFFTKIQFSSTLVAIARFKK